MIKEVKELLIQELSKDVQSIETQDKISKISSAKSWGELGISIEDGIKLLREHGIKVVLDEADKIITENPRDYSSWDSLIAIHMTNYVPQNETIYTPQSKKKQEPEFVIMYGKIYEIPTVSLRNTIHMVINNEVIDFKEVPQWDICRYAVLIPLNTIPKGQIKSGNPIDTFVEGDLQLNEQCWILCPSDEEEAVRKNNPNMNILGYNGELVRGYATALASALGYRVEPHDNYKWLNTESAEDYTKLMANEDFPIDLLHVNTVEHYEEVERFAPELFIQICSFIKEHDFITTKEEIPEFIKSIFIDSFRIYDEHDIQGIDELKEKYEKLGIDVEDRAQSLLDYLDYGIESITNLYNVLEEHGISISVFQKNIIARLNGKRFLGHAEDLISILNEEKKNTKDDEEQDFIDRVVEQVASEVKCCGRRGRVIHKMNSNKILLFNILFEGIVKSRNKELKKDGSDSTEIIESLSGQVIPEMADVQLVDETQRTIISQERQVENTKDK